MNNFINVYDWNKGKNIILNINHIYVIEGYDLYVHGYGKVEISHESYIKLMKRIEQ